jgi:predicted RNase H-like nuclease
MTWLAGVDGCPGGWIVAFVRPQGDEARITIVQRFSDVLAAPEQAEIVAVDIPIGLPECAGRGGRATENAVRPLLGKRQSSVFSIPSRTAVFVEVGPFADQASLYDAHQRACLSARATSNPAKGIAIQTFMIFPKIREVDAVLRGDPSIPERVFETHPEVAFWRLNGERALAEPKKVKGKCHEPGLALRRRLLMAAGLPAAIVEGAPPRGAGPDDVLDALACATIARRLHAGVAQSFPHPQPRDAFGLPMAIWA